MERRTRSKTHYIIVITFRHATINDVSKFQGYVIITWYVKKTEEQSIYFLIPAELFKVLNLTFRFLKYCTFVKTGFHDNNFNKKKTLVKNM